MSGYTGSGGGGGGGYTHPNHSGDVTSVGDGAQTIINDVVTFAKMQNSTAADRLVGRGGGAGAGDFQEIALGTNLSMSGTTLNVTGGAGDVVASGTLTSNSVMLGNGTTSIKAVAGIISDGISKWILGVAGSVVGSLDFKNATSGTLNVAPQTGDLGTSNLILPAVSGTLTVNDAAQVLTNKTLDADSNTITNIARLKVDSDNTLPATCAKGEIRALDNGTLWSGQGTNDWQQILTASDIGGVRAVTGTTDTILSTDFSKMVTYSNASSIAVTLPQAGSGSPASFLSGWYLSIQNLGAGTVTITPTTSTINGGATLVLLSGQFASIYSDGTNYVAHMPVNKVNGLTVTNSSGTLTITNGKTASFSNSVTFAGTDSTTMTFPSASANIGYLESPINSQSDNYTCVLADSGKTILETGASKTVTIPANGSVAYPVGTCISGIFTNATGGSVAITTDTMTLANSTTTGTRTVAQNGRWTAQKMTSTTWLISGVGIT